MKRPYFIAGWVLIAAGWVAGLFGWLGVQGTTEVPAQLAYLASGNLMGLGFVVVGAALLAIEDRRDVRESVVELREQLDDVMELLATRDHAPGPRQMVS